MPSLLEATSVFRPAWGLRIIGWLRLEGTQQIILFQCLCLPSPWQGRRSIHQSAASLGITACQAWGGGSAAVPLLPTCAWSSDPSPCQRLNARLPRDGREQMEGWESCEEGASHGDPSACAWRNGLERAQQGGCILPCSLGSCHIEVICLSWPYLHREGKGAFLTAASSEIEPGTCSLQHFVPRAVLLHMAQVWLGSLEKEERK